MYEGCAAALEFGHDRDLLKMTGKLTRPSGRYSKRTWTDTVAPNFQRGARLVGIVSVEGPAVALCAEELSLRVTVEEFREEFSLSEFGPHTETYFASAPKAGMAEKVLRFAAEKAQEFLMMARPRRLHEFTELEMTTLVPKDGFVHHMTN